MVAWVAQQVYPTSAYLLLRTPSIEPILSGPAPRNPTLQPLKPGSLVTVLGCELVAHK
jgi:hypothetical protein